MYEKQNRYKNCRPAEKAEASLENNIYADLTYSLCIAVEYKADGRKNRKGEEKRCCELRPQRRGVFALFPGLFSAFSVFYAVISGRPSVFLLPGITAVSVFIRLLCAVTALIRLDNAAFVSFRVLISVFFITAYVKFLIEKIRVGVNVVLRVVSGVVIRSFSFRQFKSLRFLLFPL